MLKTAAWQPPSVYGHSTVNVPHLIRSGKSSNVGLCQYLTTPSHHFDPHQPGNTTNPPARHTQLRNTTNPTPDPHHPRNTSISPARPPPPQEHDQARIPTPTTPGIYPTDHPRNMPNSPARPPPPQEYAQLTSLTPTTPGICPTRQPDPHHPRNMPNSPVRPLPPQEYAQLTSRNPTTPGI